MVSTWVEVLGAVIWSAVTLAVLVATPGAPASVRMVIVAVPALARVPSRQVTVPPASEQVPAVVVTCKYETFDGSGSVTITLVALAGPLLVTASV